jgi:putative membrane protein
MDILQTIPVADTWGMHGDLSAGWWLTMMVIMALFWGAIIIGAGWLMRGSFNCWPWMGRRTETTPETPADVLDRRFAHGDISAEDYQARRRLLAEDAAEPNGGPKDEALTAPGVGERSP